jgi:hypothetical protein
MKIILSIFIILSATQLMAEAPMSSKKIKASEKCPQMLKGFEAAKKLTIPDEQKAMMMDTLKKNGCLK